MRLLLLMLSLFLLSGCSSVQPFVDWQRVCAAEAKLIEKVCNHTASPETCAEVRTEAEALCIARHTPEPTPE